jgi:diacylglycerol kinase family enzyme
MKGKKNGKEIDLEADGKTRKKGRGKFAWRQGMLKVGGVLKPVWITVTPTKGGITKEYTLKPPDDAQILKRTPKQTAYAKGREFLPKSALVGMGAFDVTILPDGTPKLKFRRSRG